MKSRFSILVISLLVVLDLFGKSNVKTIEGTCNPIMVSDDMTKNQVREEAVKQAKIQALSDAFGTTIELFEMGEVTQEKDLYYSMCMDNVKGEWLETIGEPKFVETSENGMTFITCTIKGKARRKNMVETNIQMNVLRNGTNLDCKASEFHDGNRMYVHFSTPVSGYITLFIHDMTSDVVSCLLPYKKVDSGAIKVEHDKNYVFLSKKIENIDNPQEVILGPQKIDECVVTCSEDGEVNTVYVLFSRNEFSKPRINKGGRYQQDYLKFEDFFKWLTQCKTQDETLVVKQSSIKIYK